MLKNYLLFFFTFALLSNLSSEIQIKGLVTDLKGRPIESVTVSLLSPNLSLTCLTDFQGVFSFSPLPDGARIDYPLSITFEREGFYTEKKSFRNGGAKIELHIHLTPAQLLREQVTVTALNEEEKAISIPFAQSVVSQAQIQKNQPESIVDAAGRSPGVSFIGKGGISVTPSIRGLARRRILLLKDGARIVSDRSAGAAASFMPTDWIERIEVVRSAAAVLYGSDAMGGVLQVLSRPDFLEKGWSGQFSLTGESASRRVEGSLQLAHNSGPFSLSGRVQQNRSGDYQTPEGIILASGYRYTNGEINLEWKTEKRTLHFSLLASAGRDVGKPERANDPDKYSVYPYENLTIIQGRFEEREVGRLGDLHADLFLTPNGYQLKKMKIGAAQEDISTNRSTDAGGRLFFRKPVSSVFSYQWGIDYFGRFGVRMENQTLKKGIETAVSLPVDAGYRHDAALYFTFDYAAWKSFDIVGGFRYSFFQRRARADGQPKQSQQTAPAFFLGLTRKISPTFTVFLNAGTAYRVPSLSEAFYTGITGRSSIVGNPRLTPERSLQFDCGLKFSNRNLFVGAYLFSYFLRDLIEKYPLPGGSEAYTYENLEKGTLTGGELEFQIQPCSNLELFGHGFYFVGENRSTSSRLNDVPAPRVILGTRYWKGRFWAEANWLWSAPLRHPGPAEVENEAYHVVDIKTGLYLSTHWNLFLRLGNLFNQLYYPNADPDIARAKGFDLSATVVFKL